MKLSRAIDLYITDQRMYGRINSDRTEHSYRSRLNAHCDDVNNRDPSKVGREDVKKTLRRWAHPNTQRNAHSILVAFYNWCVEEDLRKDNPALQIRRAKKRPTSVYRLTKDECELLLSVEGSLRERAVLQLGLLAGLRVQEMRGMQLKHFLRPGWVHVSEDIAKGSKERWVPVLPELEPLVEEIIHDLMPQEYVVCTRKCIQPEFSRFADDHSRPASPRMIWQTVRDLAEKAGINAPIHPHLLRHGFGDHVARYAGLRAAQALLGHADVGTTQSTYVGEVTLDELAVSVHGFRYGGVSPISHPANPHKAPTRIELVRSEFRVLEPSFAGLLAVLPSELAGKLAFIDLFREAAHA